MIKLTFALIAILGYIANINDRKLLSYWIWFISNGFWAYYNAVNKEFELSLMFMVYMAFCLWGMNEKNYK
jgi:hypothetical protein